LTALYRYRAHAKINLGLEVLGRRTDGYHEVRTVLQSIALYDVIEVHPAAEEIVLTCSDPNLGTGEENLIMKAARALQVAFDCPKGARIHLTKRIPMQAGLGGGSSNAAVALLAMARLWRLPTDPDSLMPIARKLGSDVPYFLLGGTVLAVGRGEEVYALPDAPRFHLLIVRPSAGMSTGEAYSLLDSGLTGPRSPNRIMSIVQKLVDGKLDEGLFFNRFEEVATRRGDEAAALRQALMDVGASLGMLAGSGASWVGIFASRAQAQEAYRRMAHRGISGLLSSTISRRDYWELTQPRMGKENLP
jgi:4-diphosphocytidyl-2-C-methyl-D-erythritol kinase